MTEKLTVGFIPLVDAASVLIAKDFGFAEAENLHLNLVREVSWANIREKLSAGMFDAAHMLAPMAIASPLGVMPGTAPFTAPYVLTLNGNAITLGKDLYHDLMTRLDRSGELASPVTPLKTARSLSRIIAERKKLGKPPLTFGTTFPFSCHTYLLRFWMAAGEIDTSDDIRIIVLPPPAMVESLDSGEVDGFCVGAPWNSVAVDGGVGRILHLGCDIVSNLTEKVIAARQSWALEHEDLLSRLMRAVDAAAHFVRAPENWTACCERLSARDRIDAPAELIERALSGALKVGTDSASPPDSRFLMVAAGSLARPDPVQAAWLYSQMARWGQVAGREDFLHAAMAVHSPLLFDRTFGLSGDHSSGSIETFCGPAFDEDGIADYLAASAGT